MKTNFLNLVAKMPQNTGGGNSQTKRATLALLLRYLCAMLLALILGVGNMWAEGITSPYKITLNGSGNAQTICTALAAGSAQTDGTGTPVNSDGEVVWTLTKQAGTSTFTVARNSNGLKIGAGTSDYGGVTISSSSFSDFTITKVTIVAKNQTTSSSNKVMTTKWNVSVGGSALGEEKVISNDNSDKTLNFESTEGLQGTLQIVCDNTGEYKNYYFIKSIEVTFAASAGPVDPTITFNNGNYTIGGADLDLSSLFTSNSKGVVTYSIKNANGTGAALRADGKSFYATTAGTATVQASQAAEEGKYKAKAVTATITVAACETSISAQPENASLKVGDANPTLIATANNASAYAWKESSNGTDKDGAEVLGTGDTFTPSVNNAAQTKYYYCEVTSSCDGTTVVKSDIATVEVTLSVEPVVVYQWNTVGTTNLYSTAENSTVKIKNTTTNSVKFGNGVKITDGVWANHAAIIAAGDYAFLKGDKVTITHCYSKSSNNATKTGIWDGNATETTSPLASFESANVYDGNTNATTSTYTLTANSDSLYVGRDGGGSGAHVTLLKVERPAIESATAVISAVKVNGTAISAANLATLLSEKSLTLSENASTTPTVNFYKTSTIKYVEDIEDGSYTKEIAATVTQPSNYKAVVTIDEVEYTINIPKAASTDATLSALTVGGEAVEGFAAATLTYNVELPFGTTAVPAVAATANDANAKEVKVTQATALPGAATVVVKAEDNTTTKTYTINFTVADSKDIRMAWNTSNNFCSGAEKYSSAVKSDNALVSAYINKITFTNVEGSGDNGAEGGSLNVGKKTGNMFTLTAKAGYAIKAMQFAAKIQDATCEYSLNGGDWTTLSSTNTDGDACYTVFSDEEVHEFRLRSTGTSGVWIRNMELSIITACTPVKLTWTAEPAAEYEVGKAASAIAATANNGGAVAYSTTASGIVNVAANGALTIAGLGSVTLKAATAEGDGTAYCTNGGEDIVISKAVNTYYLVKFNAQNETAVNEVKYYAGDVAIATPVQPSYSGFVFQGWFDAASAGNAVAFPLTPESSRTIYAQWVAECTGPTINVHPASANYLTGRTASALTCEATAGAAGELTYTWYSCDDAERTNPVALVGAPTPSTAVAGTFYYYCAVTEAGCDIIRNSNVATITIEDKEPVCIIKSTPTSGTEADVDGIYQGSAYFKGKAENKKLNSKYDYVAVQLMEGKSFLATDKVVLNQAADLGDASDITKFYVFTEVPADGKTYVTVDNAAPVKGDNWFDMPAEMAGESSLYIGRVDANCNPSVGYLAVYRVMNPELMAISINGRTGVADELTANKFNVTIPYEAVLANLSITKTVAWNAPHATTPATVISNEGAWVIGDNTYRVMDKDGDYTDYTITLTRDVLKYQVSFNTDGGNAIDPVEVVANSYLTAGQVPANPEKEDYAFKGWSLTAGGALIADIKTVQIDGPKTFIANWEDEVAYKLIIDNETPGTKKINNVDYFTSVTLAASPVEISDVNYAYIVVGGGAGSDVSAAPSGVTYNKDRVIAYNAKTTETKIKVTAYNNSTSNRSFRISFVEDGQVQGDVTASNETVNLKKDGTITTTEYYTFNSAKNRTIYITVPGSVGDVFFLQVKAVESGEDLKKAGEVGYSLNFNKGRMVGAKQTVHSNFEGFEFYYNNNYELMKSTSMVLNNAANDYIKFHAPTTGTLAISAESAGVFYVTKDAKGTENETTAENGGTVYVDLTVADKDWYITPKGGDVKITNIEFIAPKCAEPAFNSLANSELCEGEAFEALDGTATVGDAGTPIYQWYNADGDEAIEGATSAKYTPNATGSYYVIATNQLAGYSDNSKKSTTVTVTRLASTEITGTVNVKGELGATTQKLSVTATGSGSLTYAWYAYDIVNEETIGAKLSETNELGGLTITEETQYYQVTVTGDCGSVSEILTVSKWIAVEQADVTGSRTWDWNKTSNAAAWSGVANIQLSGSDKTTDIIMANTSSAMPNNEHFRSDMLVSNGEYPARPSQDNGVFQGYAIKFHTTVPGVVAVTYRGTSGDDVVKLQINDWADETGISSGKDNMPTKKMFVPAGDVTIKEKDGKVLRINKIVFNADADYTRDVSAGNYLTICLPTAGVMTGASIYEIAYYEEASQKIFLDEVMNGVMVADRPYVFQATGSSIGVFYTEEEKVPVTAGNYKGLYGTYTELSTVTDGSSSKLWNKYIISGNQYIHVDANNCILPAYRAYIDMTHVEGYGNMLYAAPAPTPGRRRIAIGGKAPQIATGLEDAAANEKPVKVLINGEMFIIRGEKMYDATGRLVK